MARQKRLPGTSGKVIPELDEAGSLLRKKNKAISKLREEIGAVKLTIVELMQANHLTVYTDDDAAPPFTITLTPGKEKVKVSDVGDEEEEDDKEAAA